MEDNNVMIRTILERAIPSIDKRDELLQMVDKRLDFGKKKYGHGVRVFSDINEYKTDWNKDIKDMDWTTMAIEEALDGLVYLAAEMIRHPEKQNPFIYKAMEHQVKAAIFILIYQHEGTQ